jgi:hypothetical protein
MSVVPNENNELIPQRVVVGYRMCIDYRKFYKVTKKDHYPLPFIDQMLERLSKKTHFCFLDGYSDFSQIAVRKEDQEKTTFTCPYGTYAYRRMPFSLCNAPATFQRCMSAIFHGFCEEIVEVFMDYFSVYETSFDNCLHNKSSIIMSYLYKLIYYKSEYPTILIIIIRKIFGNHPGVIYFHKANLRK